MSAYSEPVRRPFLMGLLVVVGMAAAIAPIVLLGMSRGATDFGYVVGPWSDLSLTGVAIIAAFPAGMLAITSGLLARAAGPFRWGAALVTIGAVEATLGAAIPLLLFAMT